FFVFFVFFGFFGFFGSTKDAPPALVLLLAIFPPRYLHKRRASDWAECCPSARASVRTGPAPPDSRIPPTHSTHDAVRFNRRSSALFLVPAASISGAYVLGYSAAAISLAPHESDGKGELNERALTEVNRDRHGGLGLSGAHRPWLSSRGREQQKKKKKRASILLSRKGDGVVGPVRRPIPLDDSHGSPLGCHHTVHSTGFFGVQSACMHNNGLHVRWMHQPTRASAKGTRPTPREQKKKKKRGCMLR
ncbi:hypothetical protein MAPG_09606, partial [Magnaporthiopsis poae ATCC 64411]|uniref:Uncharacterized protein n=1 Tax=Magnaporthiopsis poae (strain ATCC 64411 / 73-15) TaxID=644358 RepID=A0A0C4EAD7_MAGP6